MPKFLYGIAIDLTEPVSDLNAASEFLQDYSYGLDALKADLPKEKHIVDEEGFVVDSYGEKYNGWSGLSKGTNGKETFSPEELEANGFAEMEFGPSSIISLEWGMHDSKTVYAHIITRTELPDTYNEVLYDWMTAQCTDGLGEAFEQQDFSLSEDGNGLHSRFVKESADIHDIIPFDGDYPSSKPMSGSHKYGW